MSNVLLAMALLGILQTCFTAIENRAVLETQNDLIKQLLGISEDPLRTSWVSADGTTIDVTTSPVAGEKYADFVARHAARVLIVERAFPRR